jgi:hypothetical protein
MPLCAVASSLQVHGDSSRDGLEFGRFQSVARSGQNNLAQGLYLFSVSSRRRPSSSVEDRGWSSKMEEG